MRTVLEAGPILFGVPLVFLLFGATLAGVLAFHRRSLQIALAGLVLIVGIRLGFSHLDLGAVLREEWGKLANLFALLVGFSVLADQFERSHVPDLLPRLLPGGAIGCFTLLVIIWLLSGLLDNIAAALIGGTVAASVFRGRVHLGYLAAIVAAANAGGAGSVLGDTTTTMIWIEGVSPLAVLPAYLGAASALLVFGTIASRQQHRLSPVQSTDAGDGRIDGGRLALVLVALAAMVATNLLVRRLPRSQSGSIPFLGATLWVVLLAGGVARPLNWKLIPEVARNSIFLLALVASASMMPVQALPAPSWRTAAGMGFVSSVFDNIPLTKLALNQGGYDWALLAYSVGFGGSMVWFGSSAGVAIAGLFPEAKSVGRWLRDAWHVPVAFVVGFFVLFAARGWNP
jgi:hypothetical protein